MTRTIRLRNVCTMSAVAVALAGCGPILAPQPDLSKSYVLTPTADARSVSPAAAQGSSENFTLGLGPIEMPQYLDRLEVVTRTAPNKLDLSKTDRWGEPLKDNFTGVLTRDLGAQIGTKQIVAYPWYRTTHVDMQVQVEVYRFDTDSQGNAQLSAKWTVRDGDGKNILLVAESKQTQQSRAGDTADAIAALSRTIGDLSKEIANSVQQLPAPKAGSVGISPHAPVIAKTTFAPHNDQTRFYLLAPTADAQSAPPPASAPSAPPAAGQSSSENFTLGLGPIELPRYLDRLEVVTRTAPNKMDLSKTDRWGEPLKDNFTGVLTRDLVTQIGTRQIVVYPWYSTTHVDMQVQVEVYRFDTDSQGNTQLFAKWTVRDGDGKNILMAAESRQTQRSKAGDTADAVAALSRTIGDLSKEIANSVRQLRARSSTPPA